MPKLDRRANRLPQEAKSPKMTDKETELREKIIDRFHWKEFKFIGQDNMIFEGSLTQESEEIIVGIALQAFKEAGGVFLGQDRPKIVCLCGSTKFKDAFTKAQLEETLAGRIVLTIGCNMKSDTEIFGHLSQAEFNSIKVNLDELHKRKIDLADEVLVLNVDNYIGESTASEIAYAKKLGKPVRYAQEKIQED